MLPGLRSTTSLSSESLAGSLWWSLSLFLRHRDADLEHELEDEVLYFLLLAFTSCKLFRDLPRPFLLEAEVFEVGVVPSPVTLLLGEDVILRLLLLLLFMLVDVVVVVVAARGPLVQWEQHQLGDMGRCSRGGVVQLTW